MPQLDLVPYAAQFVWLTLIVAAYYVFCVHSLLPTLSTLLKTRAAREVEVVSTTFDHPSTWAQTSTEAFLDGLTEAEKATANAKRAFHATSDGLLDATFESVVDDVHQLMKTSLLAPVRASLLAEDLEYPGAIDLNATAYEQAFVGKHVGWDYLDVWYSSQLVKKSL